MKATRLYGVVWISAHEAEEDAVSYMLRIGVVRARTFTELKDKPRSRHGTWVGGHSSGRGSGKRTSQGKGK